MKETRVHNYRQGYENAGDTVARATMGCGNAGRHSAEAIMGCDNAGRHSAEAIMGCDDAGRHSAEASSYMEHSLRQTTGGQMGRPDIEQFSTYNPAKGR